MIIRSLLRDPLVTRPLSRAIRRMEDDFWVDDWTPKRPRRANNLRYSPVSLVEHMDNSMSNVMQDLVEDINHMESLISRYEPENWTSRVSRSGGDNLAVKRTESGGLQLALDVAGFKPEELKIRLVDDTHLVVEATSETSGKDSYQKSHFKRWFKLPEDCKVDEIRSRLTEDKRLLVELPTNKPLKENGRSIPIEMANQPEVDQQASQTKQGTQPEPQS